MCSTARDGNHCPNNSLSSPWFWHNERLRSRKTTGCYSLSGIFRRGEWVGREELYSLYNWSLHHVFVGTPTTCCWLALIWSGNRYKFLRLLYIVFAISITGSETHVNRQWIAPTLPSGRKQNYRINYSNFFNHLCLQSIKYRVLAKLFTWPLFGNYNQLVIYSGYAIKNYHSLKYQNTQMCENRKWSQRAGWFIRGPRECRCTDLLNTFCL